MAGGRTATTTARPTNPQVFTATGLNLTYAGGQTAFDLFLDAGTAVGNGVQARVSYDLTGNGTFDRVETYRYFATDPVPGYEHYTQTAGPALRHRHAGQPVRRHGQGGGLVGDRQQPDHPRHRQPVGA